MSKYRLLSLFWVIPAYLIFITFQQAMVHYGSKKTLEQGVTYAAEVMDIQLKQIAAQANGYIVFKFTTPDEGVLTRKHTLTMQMAQTVMKNNIIPISYRKGGYPEIVIVPTYGIQYTTSLYNMWVAIAAVIITVIAGFKIQRFSNARSKTGVEKINIERIN